MGTRFACELPGPGRLLPFEFSTDQAYALAMTQGRMQPLALGGAVLEEELEITAVTNANPAQVTVPYHGYSTGDEWFAKNVEGMPEINGRVFTITVVDGDNFTIGVDSTDWGVFTGSGGGTLREEPPAPEPDPPVVPDPVDPPEPPDIGGGGVFCVTDDTPILLANDDRSGPGEEAPAASFTTKTWVWTRHEATGEWGAFPVARVEFADEPVLRCFEGGWREPIRATGSHPFETAPGAGPWAWVCASDIGEPAGMARVAKIEVEGAHTYISAGILSHNKRADGEY